MRSMNKELMAMVVAAAGLAAQGAEWRMYGEGRGDREIAKGRGKGRGDRTEK